MERKTQITIGLKVLEIIDCYIDGDTSERETAREISTLTTAMKSESSSDIIVKSISIRVSQHLLNSFINGVEMSNIEEARDSLAEELNE